MATTTIHLNDLDSSDDDDDDSIMNTTYLARAATRPPPLKKRDVVLNVFAVDSSDDDEDAEIATLTGSQPLSLVAEEVSLDDSPAGGIPLPHRRSPETIVTKTHGTEVQEGALTLSKSTTASRSSHRLPEHQQETKLPSQKFRASPPHDLEGLEFVEAKPESSSLGKRADFGRHSKKTKKTQTAPSAREVLPRRPMEEVVNQKETSKKSGKAKGNSMDTSKGEQTTSSKAERPESKSDIDRKHDPSKPSVDMTIEQAKPSDGKRSDDPAHALSMVASTTTTVAPSADPQRHQSKQRADSVELLATTIQGVAGNNESTKKKRSTSKQEKEADKKCKTSSAAENKISHIKQFHDVEECHRPKANESETTTIQGLKSVYAQVEAVVEPAGRSPTVKSSSRASSKNKPVDIAESITVAPRVPITETFSMALPLQQESSLIVKYSSSTTVQQPNKTDDAVELSAAAPCKKKRPQATLPEAPETVPTPKPANKMADTDTGKGATEVCAVMSPRTTSDQLVEQKPVETVTEDRSTRESKKKRQKRTVTEKPSTAKSSPPITDQPAPMPLQEHINKESKETTTSKVESAKPAKASSAKAKSAAPKTQSKKMNFQDQVVKRLFWSFKPFTLRTLSEDLKTTETTLEFCLISLIDKGLVMKKDFSSSKGGRVKTLYWANHDAKSKEVEFGNEATFEDREKTKQEVQSVQIQLNDLKTELSLVLLQPSNVELSEQVIKAESELQAVRQQIGDVKDRIEEWTLSHKSAKKRPFGAVASVPSSPRNLKRRINHMREEWKNRKAKCGAFLEVLADGLEKKPKDVIKLLDLDTDEMNGVTLPAKQDV